MGTHKSFEKITWFRPGIKYPVAGQKIMMLFHDGSIVISLYDDFANWCPKPLRWARHPVGPEGFAREEALLSARPSRRVDSALAVRT